MKFYTSLFFFIVTIHLANAMKGRLLLIGGGSEQTEGWSKPAYKWAVDKSANKRVAIIGTNAPTIFLSNYFKTSLGAVAAKDFTIVSLSAANTQSIYDSLITYDVIFFRGGDQSLYYNYYKNTKLSDAVKFVFNKGGVIAGTSAGLHVLSTVLYNALDASITSDQAIANVRSGDITLANDFFNFFPGYIFDSHVAERGRFPRTIAFLSRWYLDRGEKIKAVAMDDLTAMGIDTNEVGTVFGTGAAGIYQTISKQSSPYRLTNNMKLTTDSILVKHLLNGWTYDFRTQKITKPILGTSLSIPSVKQEQGAYTFYAGGNEYLTSYREILKQVVRKNGNASDRIILVSDDSIKVLPVKNELMAQGASRVNIILNISNDTLSSALLQNATKFVFMGNTFAKLNTMMASSIGTGKQLNDRIHAAGAIVAFIGADARFIGKRMLSDNYAAKYAAYDGLITTSKGLGLLQTALLFPDALGTADSKENSVCTVPYFVMKDTLTHGVLLTGDTYLKYKVLPNGKAYFTSGGSAPAIILRNDGNTYSLSNTTSKNNGTQKSRQIAGFDSLYITMADTTNPYLVGTGIAYKASLDTLPFNGTIASLGFNPYSESNFQIYPNPIAHREKLYITLEQEEVNQIVAQNLLGASIDLAYTQRINSSNNLYVVHTQDLASGIYILELRTSKNKVIRQKLVIADKL